MFLLLRASSIIDSLSQSPSRMCKSRRLDCQVFHSLYASNSNDLYLYAESIQWTSPALFQYCKERMQLLLQSEVAIFDGTLHKILNDSWINRSNTDFVYFFSLCLNTFY